ncbi:MAG: prepilin peptidase [Anaerolineae bacterium]|nr:prepilin peptidase [Anaerolineae bacterium]
MQLIALILAGLFGVLAGAVVNALADYLPSARFVALADEAQEPAPLMPHYPDGTGRAAIAWSGMLAFITGRRRAASGAMLPLRHLLVEVFLAIAFIFVLVRYGWNLQAVFYWVFLAIMALVTVIDIEHKLVLFVVMLPAWLIAVLEAALVPDPPPLLRDALLGGALGFGLFFFMFLGGIVFSRVSRTNEIAFGFGDVLLGVFSGLLLGWRPIFFALVLTILLGALGAIAFLGSKLVSRTGYSMFTALPYGPYIVAATLIVMFWRDEIRVLISGGW